MARRPAAAFRRPSFLRGCKHAIETALVYVVYGFFGLMPMETASGLGGRLLSSLGPRLGISRVARNNLNLAFPEKTATEKETILRGMWDNLGRVIGEYPHLHRIWQDVEVVGRENFEAARDSGKAALLFSAHIANWEIPAIRKKTGLDIHIVYRKPNNPWVDGLLRHARASGAAGYIEKGP